MGKEKKDGITELIETGAELSGVVGASLLGAIVAGPFGAIIGGASGMLIKKSFETVGFELKSRILGKREEVRIGAAFTYGMAKIKERIDKGESVREDSFFLPYNERRPASDELLEGVLLSAQREYEELKVKYYGYLMANIAFSPDIGRSRASFLIRIVERLSYRQLCLIELFNDTNKYNLYVKKKNNPPNYEGDLLNRRMFLPEENQFATYLRLSLPLNKSTADLYIEIKELIQYGFLKADTESYNLTYDTVELTFEGKRIRNLLGLDELETANIEEIASQLRVEE